MKIQTILNGWALVCKHKGNRKRYYVRHIKCGTYLHTKAVIGCTCKGKPEHGVTRVDPTILVAFQLFSWRSA